VILLLAELVERGLFWLSVGVVCYAYIGYPIVIFSLSRLMGKSSFAPESTAVQTPRVALLIAAHNEEAVIEQRIQNALQLQYQRDRLEIVIASDGSGQGRCDK
jgi:biofilm PGA synthesis N-glycosyltransferase PgaC